MEIEHSIIPPYLCALYSIKPGRNREASETIASVFMEEMLHMTLAANILNAVGGRPVLDKPDFIPAYPQYLPHSARGFLIPLSRFSKATIETFMKIENPGFGGSAETDAYHSQGQFYLSIEEGLKSLVESLGEARVFTGDPARQITGASADYTGAGRVIAVTDLDSALAAVNEIEEQGEGMTPKEVWDGDRDMFHPERDEVAHFFRYQQVMLGRMYQRGDSPASGPTGAPFDVDWDDVHPMRENPRTADYAPGSPVRVKMDAFNLRYSDMLRMLDRAFNGEPAQLRASMRNMRELRALAIELMQMPSGDGVTTAGPAFEYVARPAARAEAAPVKVPAAVPRAPTAAPEAVPLRITVRKDGPYVVEGGVPLTRKSIVLTEKRESMTWQKDAELDAAPVYKLCRCGLSANKPFCDNSHLLAGFDGTETAPIEPSSGRRVRLTREHITITDDKSLCTIAGFCGNHVEHVWEMLDHMEDSRTTFDIVQRVERCPSGRLIHERNGVPIEPDLPKGIAVTKDGPYWVTGGVTIELSDGRTLEVRNRVQLCRCGKSENKPLCDGAHKAAGFKEG